VFVAADIPALGLLLRYSVTKFGSRFLCLLDDLALALDLLYRQDRQVPSRFHRRWPGMFGCVVHILMTFQEEPKEVRISLDCITTPAPRTRVDCGLSRTMSSGERSRTC
jgi:hypothetical protein